ncbi:unnamed protein product [Cyprideis torosa]|uniref:Selenocysteine-specific elongation factor n=1 Tax=Cyprideis torosa TaxID=163714 RepID=A0A7R8WIR9_9CRUS|nr:unnamed protein product [Cyprideis torosa]CAG0898268.1 unnamed protein product [Cyprideis torosa]
MDSNTNVPCNINVGVLGHVDSGKTALCQALSSVASTACFDKNPQSQERGITLDLGFSSFLIDTPLEKFPELKHLPPQTQITLVDCPGHASLIRTIIGGAQIIDVMLLVVDASKGIQTQTAECLVIGELTCSKMIVVLNKIDLISDSAMTKMKKRLALTLESTRFKGAPIIPVSARPGGGGSSDGSSADKSSLTRGQGLEELVRELREALPPPVRKVEGDFLFAVDHCFAIRGQGTVLTGTVLQGAVVVNQTVEIPALRITRKVKSMQVFRKSVSSVKVGDRVGICLTQVDSSAFERGLVCAPPGSVPLYFTVIARVEKIRFFKHPVVSSKQGRFHISLGHETLMGKLTLFGSAGKKSEEFDMAKEYPFLQELPDGKSCFALIEFDQGVYIPEKSLLIGSRMDADIHSSSCRLAFQGHVVHGFKDKQYVSTELPQLKIFKVKTKEGVVDRAPSKNEVILRNLFTKESKFEPFLGLKIKLDTGEVGVLEGSFGASGKCKVRMIDELTEETFSRVSSSKKEKKSQPITAFEEDVKKYRADLANWEAKMLKEGKADLVRASSRPKPPRKLRDRKVVKKAVKKKIVKKTTTKKVVAS